MEDTRRRSSGYLFHDTLNLSASGYTSSPRPTVSSTLRTTRFTISDGGSTTRSRRRKVDGEPIGEKVFHPGLKRFAKTGAVSGEDAAIPSLRGTWSATTGSQSGKLISGEKV